MKIYTAYTKRIGSGSPPPKGGDTTSLARSRVVIYLLLFLLVALSLGQVALSTKLAVSAERISQKEATLVTLDQENQVLQKESDRLGALSVIEGKADLLGFSKVGGNILYLESSDFLAKSQ